jgi:hypothetical protein
MERRHAGVIGVALALAASLIENHRIDPLPDDRYVVVLTGRKS